MTPSLNFENLLDWLTELRKELYLLILVCYKGCKSGRPTWKTCTGEGVGEGHRAHSLGMPPSSTIRRLLDPFI